MILKLHSMIRLHKSMDRILGIIKCGDDLTVPHFLSWNPIKTEKPDFHRPEFFGTVKFVQ